MSKYFRHQQQDFIFGEMLNQVKSNDTVEKAVLVLEKSKNIARFDIKVSFCSKSDLLL